MVAGSGKALDNTNQGPDLPPRLRVLYPVLVRSTSTAVRVRRLPAGRLESDW